MEIVIKIPDEAYELLKSKSTLDNIAESIIANGTPLPKGHGDLIDREYFIGKYAGCGSVYCDSSSCEDCNSRIVSKLDIDSATTIIEADKESKDGTDN